MNKTWLLGAATAALLIASVPGAMAQTAIPMPPPARPVPDSVVQQAGEHANGKFSPMGRARLGGQVQEAWDDAEDGAGVFEFSLCGACTYKVRVREHMVTVLELPEGEVIERADVDDGGSFKVDTRGPRRLVIKPLGYGVDTNLMIYGVSGAVYPVYLRAESFNSVNVPDLFVRIVGQVASADTEVAGIELPASGTVSGLPAGSGPLIMDPVLDAISGLETPAPSAKAGDFVQEADFDPDALRGWGDYKLWAGGPDGDTLRPETVFRDDQFTYIRFGDRWKDVELPTAYVVVDDVDELINTRVQGRTYIIESTRPLITLKSGLSYLCINYEGET